MSERFTLAKAGHGGARCILFWCPGCEEHHGIDPDEWTWNGDLENPTFSPSLLVTKHQDGRTQCHLFIEDGNLRFLGDCNHSLAGQTVPAPEMP